MLRKMEDVLDNRQKSMQIGESDGRVVAGRTTKSRKLLQLFCRVTDSDISYYIGEYMYKCFRMSAGAFDRELPKFWINRHFYYAALGPVATDLDAVYDRAMLFVARQIKTAYAKNVKDIRRSLNDTVSSDRAVIQKMFSANFGGNFYVNSYHDDVERNSSRTSQPRSSSSGISTILFLLFFIIIVLLFLFFGHK